MQAGLFSFFEPLGEVLALVVKRIARIPQTIIRTVTTFTQDRVPVVTPSDLVERIERLEKQTIREPGSTRQPTKEIQTIIEKVVEEIVIEKTIREEVIITHRDEVTNITNVTNVTEVTAPADVSNLQAQLDNLLATLSAQAATLASQASDIFILRLNTPVYTGAFYGIIKP